VAIPFLRPGDVPRVAPPTADAAAGDAFDAYLAGIRQLYQQVYELARARAADGQAIVAMGHCHMVGGDATR